MKGSTAIAAAAALASTVFAAPNVERRSISNAKTPPVTIKGNAFFAGNNRFYIRGVDYQPGGSSSNEDPIADASGCERDVAEFQKLGINTVRVYTIDNSKNHDACMKTLANAGIYLALDVNTPFFSLNRENSDAIKQSYNEVYLQSLFATVDMFQQYDNTLLFFSGNEVINNDLTTFAAPYVKAVTRDLKAYIKARGYRSIPVGYSAADVETNRYQMATWMGCGSDVSRADFHSYNDYSWCDPSGYQQSGWDKKVALFGNYSIPLFLSEYGCIKGTRKFEEVSALYNSEMTGVFSGGLVYQYSNETNGYGLVTLNGNSVDESPDFDALQTAYQGTPNPTGDGGYQTSNPASACPPASASWLVNGTDIPAMPVKAQQYFKNGAGSGPGNANGTTGSQTAGTASPGFVSDSTASDSGFTGSGNSSSGSGSKSAASSVRAPELSAVQFVAGLTVVVSSMLYGMV